MIDGAHAYFRDEDFEKYLRSVVGEAGELAAHRRLAGFFLENHTIDAEAAAVVGEHLFRGHMFERLVELALVSGEPRAIPDPVVRVQAYRRRLAFALRGALALGATADGFRLVVLAGEAARAGSAIESVVRDRPDLAMRHGDSRGVAEIYLRQDNASWRGPLHLRVSAMYARLGRSSEAAEHFELANAWLQDALRPESSWTITTSDIASGAASIYWQRGLEQAFSWLRRWRPREAVLAATAELAAEITSQADRTAQDRLLSEIPAIKLSARAEAAFLGALWWNGTPIPSATVRAVAPVLARAIRREPPRFARWGDPPRPAGDQVGSPIC